MIYRTIRFLREVMTGPPAVMNHQKTRAENLKNPNQYIHLSGHESGKSISSIFVYKYYTTAKV